MSTVPSAPPLSEEFEQLAINDNTTVSTPQDGLPYYDPPPPYTPPGGADQLFGPSAHQPAQGGYMYYQPPPPQSPQGAYPSLAWGQHLPGGYAPQYLPVGYPLPPPPGGYSSFPPGGYPTQGPPPPSQASAPPPDNREVPVDCHVCRKTNNIIVGPTTTVMICSQCREITPLAPPPVGRQYVRCQCNTLLTCALSVCETICPKDTCKAVSRLHVPAGVVPTAREVAEIAITTVQCQVCEELYTIRRESKITETLCSTCGERSPIAPPPAGSKYVRCVCLKLITVASAATAVTCPRQTCSRNLKIGNLSTFPRGSGTYPVHKSSMLLNFVNGFNTLLCDVCFEKMNIPKKMTKKILICNNCKECTPLEPPDPGKRYFRCYCNCLLICPVTSKKVLCARETCKLSLNTHSSDPSADAKKNVTFQCPVCHVTNTEVVPSSTTVLQCTCGVHVPIGPAPRGKKYVYCTCHTLLVCPITSTRIRCSRKNCQREFNV